ncbi:hypothetical protein J1N35_015455 [Gossypium stocksii]|uniref:RNase H type-1 domain-containing protein n=1 Tax=Gossypium stocksii TaxID=47602 RepID=A0A9D3VYD2_9ROSI|nr:hypothetical protein J1N35_015455 [Gossypium stocksii]
MGIPPPRPEASLDRIIWRGSTTSSFTVKSTYGKILEMEGRCMEDPLEVQKSPKDGSVRLEDDSTAVGGVVRNRNGEWIIGYIRFLESYLMFEAKLWGILDGLNILIGRGLDNVIVQMDSLEVMMAI